MTELDHTSSKIQGEGDTNGELSRARIGIETGDIVDASNALDVLVGLLRHDPKNSAAVALVRSAVRVYPELSEKARQGLTPLFEAGELDDDVLVPENLSRDAALEPGEEIEADPTAPALRRAIEQYYGGEYVAAIVTLQQILAVRPRHAAARDYLQKAQDAQARGLIPETRIPFEARVSLGKGQSLQRAGQYEEARQAFDEAIQSAQSRGVERWDAAEQAVLEIQALTVAGQFRTEGDQALALEQWTEAADRYRAALGVYPGDALAADRLAMIDEALEWEKRVWLLNLQKEPPPAMASAVRKAMDGLSEAALRMPQQQRLSRALQEAERILRNIQVHLVERGQTLLGEGKVAASLARREALTTEGVEALRMAQSLGLDTTAIEVQISSAKDNAERLTAARRVIAEARALVEKGEEADLRAAHTMLWNLAEFGGDPDFQDLRAQFYQRLLESADAALQRRDDLGPRLLGRRLPRWLGGMRANRLQALASAARLLELAKGALFQPLGEQAQFGYVQRRLQLAQEEEERLRRFHWGLAMAGLLLLLVLGFVFTWYAMS
jgi:tetratricopeptide (TPR) repeat protein